MTPTVSWTLRAVAVTAAAIVLAVITNVLAGPYFERSFLEEASPLASAGDPPAAAAPTASVAATPASEATPTADVTPAEAPEQPVAMAGILLTGEIRDGEPGHNGEGQAQILRDESGVLFLRLENFSVTNGPDLFVVLSPDAGGYADGSLNLGGLKATDGSINYEIPAGTDLSQYRSAVIWCRSFDVTFAVATLMEVT